MFTDSFDEFIDHLLASDLTPSQVIDVMDARISQDFPVVESDPISKTVHLRPADSSGDGARRGATL